MTIVVEKEAGLAGAIVAGLDERLVDRMGGVPGGVTALAGTDEVAAHLAQHPHETVVVLGASESLEDAVALAEAARVQRPWLGVVLLREKVDTATLTRALESGLRAVVDADDADGLAGAVERAHALGSALVPVAPPAPPVERHGQVVTVFSLKGGVGKSMVSTNLAVSLADRGHRVCVIDLDVACGDVAIMLRINPTATLADLQRVGTVDRSAVLSMLTEAEDGLSVMAAPTHPGQPVPPDDLGDVLRLLTAEFDVVVADTSGTFDDHALVALDHADQLVLVGTPDIPSLKSLKLATGTLDLLDLPRERRSLVLNRVEPKVGLTTAEVEETLGVPVTVAVPADREVVAVLNRTETMVRVRPGHPVSKALTQLADLVEAELVTSGETPATNRSERRGGRRRLRRKVS
ncbi:AAA family ATPase [Nocardioides bruguierae]|uniref:AAA family ATPase n=1 Tax=Nocardioides bruguierae TaxID=2945102 RepID=UPI00202291C9|nr:P-loop NTPase [Nocardioides bruguierae]MCL8024823.1 P-loop NTPase [Nocardioides bruguierae]